MIDLVIPPRRRSIGPFDVSRVLPYSKKRSVGPFVFVDEMGPLEVLRPETLDVLSHPHIGLATVTYMFRGKLMHRDSLGSVQPIAPGEVNLMNAGRGIVHSERVSGTDVEIGSSMHGIQTWIAIPENEQEGDPDFVHYGAETLPENEESGVRLRVIMGELHGCDRRSRQVLNRFTLRFRWRQGKVFRYRPRSRNAGFAYFQAPYRSKEMLSNRVNRRSL